KGLRRKLERRETVNRWGGVATRFLILGSIEIPVIRPRRWRTNDAGGIGAIQSVMDDVFHVKDQLDGGRVVEVVVSVLSGQCIVLMVTKRGVITRIIVIVVRIVRVTSIGVRVVWTIVGIIRAVGIVVFVVWSVVVKRRFAK